MILPNNCFFISNEILDQLVLLSSNGKEILFHLTLLYFSAYLQEKLIFSMYVLHLFDVKG